MLPYPLPASYLGSENVVILEHVAVGYALTIPGLSHEPAFLHVVLEWEPFAGWWKVTSDFGVLGFLDEKEAHEFPHLERLREAGMQPVTWATVELIDGAVEVAVHLGTWVWQVPRNNQPEGSVLLTGEHGHRIDTSTAHDVTPEQWEALGACQLIVELHVVGEDILATVAERVLGTIAPVAELPHIAAIVAQAAKQNARVAARAYVADSLIAVDLPVEDSPELFSASLPQLPEAEPAIPVIEEDTGITEVTIPAASAAPTPAPAGARRITVPGEAPDAVLEEGPGELPEESVEQAPGEQVEQAPVEIPEAQPGNTEQAGAVKPQVHVPTELIDVADLVARLDAEAGASGRGKRKRRRGQHRR